MVMNSWAYSWAMSQRWLHLYLQACAKLVLRAHRPLIVGITGTAGKTTTKDMLASILAQDEAVSRFGHALVTAGNMNDDLGVPLTVLRYRDWLRFGRLKPLAVYALMPVRALAMALSRKYPRLLVLEFGTHEYGHLHELVKVARPNVSVVTTIGEAHLERLGSIEGVLQEKSALVTAPPESGAVFLGADHPHVDRLAALARAPVTVVEGRGNGLNASLARAVGRHLNLSSNTIERGLADFKPPARRLERHVLPNQTVIDDSHNANPVSMRHALDVLEQSESSGARKVAVLGAMAELGAASEQSHREIGQRAKAVAGLVIGVGEAAKAYQAHHWFENAETCRKQIGDHLRDGDMILVKGSASSEMQTVADFLLSRSEAA